MEFRKELLYTVYRNVQQSSLSQNGWNSELRIYRENKDRKSEWRIPDMSKEFRAGCDNKSYLNLKGMEFWKFNYRICKIYFFYNRYTISPQGGVANVQVIFKL